MIALKRKFITDRLKKDIYDQISSGVLKDGDPILSLNQMKTKYGISKSSVEKAVRELIAEGVIESVQGKGNFVKSTPSPAGSFSVLTGKHIGLSYPMQPHSIQLIKEVKEYVLEKGGLLTVYDVTEDAQDPLKEKLFLESLEKSGATGAAVFASPIEPLNTDLYCRLRNAGFKIALLSPYQYDLSDQVCFLPDSRYAGYLAARHLAAKGYDHVVFVKVDHDPVFMQWLQEGIYTGARRSGIHYIDKAILVKGSPKDAHYSLEKLISMNRDVVQCLEELPPRTAFISRVHVDGAIVCELLRRRLHWDDSDIAIAACAADQKERYPGPIDVLQAPEREIVFSAIDYLLDDAIKAEMNFLKFFKPDWQRERTDER